MIEFDLDRWFYDTFGTNGSQEMYDKYKSLKWYISPLGYLEFEGDSLFINAVDVKKYLYENSYDTVELIREFKEWVATKSKKLRQTETEILDKLKVCIDRT